MSYLISAAVARLRADLASTAAGAGAALVGFGQGNVGGALRSLQALATYYPGVDSTGAAECAAACQAAINAAIQQGYKSIRFPGGSYKIAAQLAGFDTTSGTPAATQIAIVGDGPFATRFLPTGDFTAINLVASYFNSGGFSVEWPLTVQASIPATRIGVEFARGTHQVSQCRVSDIVVTYAYKSFFQRDWAGDPGGLGTMYVVDLERLISFRAANFGFDFTAVNGGSTTHRFSTCWANCSNSAGAAGGTGFKFSGINDLLMLNCAVDLCKDRAIHVLDGYQFNAVGLALESCLSSTDGIPLVQLNSGITALFFGVKEIAGTVNIAGGKAYGIFAGGSTQVSVSGYARAALTVTAGTLYKAGLNSADARLSVDSSIRPSDVQDNGWHVSVSYSGERISSTGQAPNYGTWYQGAYVRVGAASPGAPEGYVCTQAGTPGVWTPSEALGYLAGTAAYNPPNLASGASATTTVAVVGAALGDLVTQSFDVDLQGVELHGYVSAAGVVTVRLVNSTAGAVDLAAGNLRVRVKK